MAGKLQYNLFGFFWRVWFWVGRRVFFFGFRVDVGSVLKGKVWSANEEGDGGGLLIGKISCFGLEDKRGCAVCSVIIIVIIFISRLGLVEDEAVCMKSFGVAASTYSFNIEAIQAQE